MSADLICNICNKLFKTKSSRNRHLKITHDDNSLGLICMYCEKKFKQKYGLKRHIQTIHPAVFNTDKVAVVHGSIGKKHSPVKGKGDSELTICDDGNASYIPDESAEAKQNTEQPPVLKQNANKKLKTSQGSNRESHIKCIECNTHYKYIQELRDHLTSYHDLNMDVEEMHFPNTAAFEKWKHDIERQETALYIIQHGCRKTKKGIIKNDFYCHRSGKASNHVVGPRKRMPKRAGTSKLGIACTSLIVYRETAAGVFIKYYPHHYGHGKDISFVQLSSAEQDAIEENVSRGIPYENLLDDIKDSQSSTDLVQLYIIQKKDTRFIANAYTIDEYNPGMGEVESIQQWVRQCHEMENSPVLFYRSGVTEKLKKKLLLIIMTEFQKQILLSAAKTIICVDTLYRQKNGGIYLSVLYIMDEFDSAFPVAFCFSDKVDKGVMLQFFKSIKQSAGTLSFTHFMSDSESFIFEAWQEVMEDEPRWLWCIWGVDRRIKIKLKVFKNLVAKKTESYKTMRTLLECQNVNMFQSMFKNYVDALLSDPSSRNAGEYILQKYASKEQFWAYCYRKEVPLNTNYHLEVLHRTLNYCCREGRNRRRDKFLFVTMKFLKYKMLDRLSSILDEEKTELAIQAIDSCHNEGLEITSECITSLSDKIWLIQLEEEKQSIYVTREFEACPEHCILRCDKCDICVHMYTCSCIHSVINANMCAHIHAVVWKFLTPHFSLPGSPVADSIEDQENIDVSVIPDKCPELLEEILKRSHGVYKLIKENRLNLPKESLIAILRRLNECFDIGRGKHLSETAVLSDNCKDLSGYLLPKLTMEA